MDFSKINRRGNFQEAGLSSQALIVGVPNYLLCKRAPDFEHTECGFPGHRGLK